MFNVPITHLATFWKPSLIAPLNNIQFTYWWDKHTRFHWEKTGTNLSFHLGLNIILGNFLVKVCTKHYDNINFSSSGNTEIHHNDYFQAQAEI